jgi:hypothetical protein
MLFHYNEKRAEVRHCKTLLSELCSSGKGSWIYKTLATGQSDAEAASFLSGHSQKVPFRTKHSQPCRKT